jgi:PAS domain S-box-containing protein
MASETGANGGVTAAAAAAMTIPMFRNGGTTSVADAAAAAPMFKVRDPISNQQIDLDELFNDIYYLDQQQWVPDPAPVNAKNFTEAPPAPVVPTNTQPQEQIAQVPAPALDSPAPAEEEADKKRSAEYAGLEDHDDIDPDETESGNKDLTESQKVERRERNREHAKRSRLRKKFLLESLQEQIHALEEQLTGLKTAIKTELPDRADNIIGAICGDKDKYTPLPMPSGFGPVKTLMEPDFRLMSALSGSQQNFAISDPTLPDNPIVYCSQGFLDLTGYTLDQVLGRNCRFLQGPGTDQAAVQVIRKGITEGVDTSVCLLNYKADGTPFWNQFFVAALRDAQNNVVNYVGVQCEVSKAVVEKHMPAPMKRVTRVN